MALGIIAEWLARIEWKVDAIMVAVKAKPRQPLHFLGQQCPACEKFVEYHVNVVKNVVYRKCGCATGKQPSLIPLVPDTTTPEQRNGVPPSSPDAWPEDERTGDSPDSRRR